MSVLNQSGEEQASVECPLCMEPFEVDDLHFYPCTCGYQICRFCWNRIREGDNGVCPACRKAYPENPADFIPLSQEQVAAIKTEKKAREQKRRNKTLESRRALANVRVVQNNLVFVVGLPVRLADPETLKRQEYFGKYGKIHKVVINQSTTYAGSQGPSASAYVTYVSPADALRAIQGVSNVSLDGRVLKGSLGTTKYCAHFMKNQPCPKPDCMYLHEMGDPKASFTKEEMHAGLHQVYERKLHNQLLAATQAIGQNNSTGNPSTSAEKGSSKDGTPSIFIPTTVVPSSNINIVNSSKSKKDSGNGSNNNNNNVNGSISYSNGNKEAWPSLSSSPPAESPARKQASPKPQQNGKSQENSTLETNITKPSKNNKESHTDNNKSERRNNKENNSTSNNSKKCKNTENHKSKQKASNNDIQSDNKINMKYEVSSVQELPHGSYLTNELDELESDRHSLLENHDLLDSNEHSLLDDNTHHLLEDDIDFINLQRHKPVVQGLLDDKILTQIKNNQMTNGFSLLDRDSVAYLGNDRQVSQSLMDKEALLRERSHTEMLLRQKELLARQHNTIVDHKHYLPNSSIALDSASELLGANYHHNSNMLPPFGMLVDNSLAANSLSVNSLTVNTMAANTPTANSMGVNTLAANMGTGAVTMTVNSMNTLSANSMANTMGANSLGVNTMSANNLGVNSLGINTIGGNSLGMNAMVGNGLGMNQMVANGLGVNSMGANSLGVNTLGANNIGVNGMGPNTMNSPFMLHNQHMLHNQQSGMANGYDSPQTNNESRYQTDNMEKFFTDFHKAQQMRLLVSERHHLFNAERREMALKHRMGSNSARAAGDCDDDLDFDPFKESQKAFAEIFESESVQPNLNTGDIMLHGRMPPTPPGFGHLNTFGIVPRGQPHMQGANYGANMFADWTQMDPAIVSTSGPFKGPQQQQPQPQPHELLGRFGQLGVAPPSPWGPAYIPLPPGFAPPKGPPRSAECVDAN